MARKSKSFKMEKPAELTKAVKLLKSVKSLKMEKTDKTAKTNIWFLQPNYNYIYDHYTFEEGNKITLYVDFYQFQGEVDIYCNNPSGPLNILNKADFHRQIYKKLNASHCDDSHAEFMVHLNKAGSFHFYAIPKNSTPLEQPAIEYILRHTGSFDKLEGVCCSGIFVVEPHIKLANGATTNVDILRMQTNITKCLGKITDWESRLLVASSTDFNAIHLTPVQELGASNSNYSISDHFKLDNRYGGGLISEKLPPVITQLHKHFKCIITDIVLNHVSFDAPFLLENPDVAYNLENSPHLKPAWLVDRALAHYSKDIVDGRYRKDYIGVDIFKKKEGIDHALLIFRTRILPELHIEDYFMIDVENTLETTRKVLASASKNLTHKDLHLQDKHLMDFAFPAKFITRNNGVDFDYDKLIAKYFDFGHDKLTSEEIDTTFHKLEMDLFKANDAIKYEMQVPVLNKIVENIKGGVYYRFLDETNKAKQLTYDYPIVNHYFSDVSTVMNSCKAIEQDINHLDWYDNEVAIKKTPSKLNGKFIVAHQGWIMGDSTINFALPSSRVYLLRELIIWGDSVKLNYGNGPKDSPKLWAHMIKYVVESAKIFDGFRLDNCHSTPLHVLESLMDEARKIKPNLIVVAELFTNSEKLDNYFVNRIGITCLVRERMVANRPDEFCRLVHRFGGTSVASFYDDSHTVVQSTLVKALFTDLTHDNPCPYTKFSPYDYLTTVGFVAMSTCAIASVRGFDELVPYHINVVEEERKYGKWLTNINFSCGILEARRVLNELHDQLHMDGYSQIYVDQISESIISVTRTNPTNWSSMILIINTAFEKVPEELQPKFVNKAFELVNTAGFYPEVQIPGIVKKVCVEATLAKNVVVNEENHLKSDERIEPDNLHSLYIERNISPVVSKMITINQYLKNTAIYSTLYLNKFTPGSLLLVEVELRKESRENINLINGFITHLQDTLDIIKNENTTPMNPNMLALITILKHMSPSALNVVLFRTNVEENSDGNGMGVYHLPGYGDLCYCGLMGLYPILKEIRRANNLGHPLCKNLREGPWMLDYIVNRLAVHHETKMLSNWLSNCLDLLKNLPHHLLPTYFERVITLITKIIKVEIIHRIDNKSININHKFIKDMIISSYAVYGYEKSCPLPKYSIEEGYSYESVCTLSAGLPFFANSWMRSWGRDTMIAIRGLFLVTGRFKEAKALIFAHACCLRHGLIPNLLADGGKNCRYNCRDAAWWFLLAIKDYCTFVNDTSILNEKVRLLYEYDASEYDENSGKEMTLGEVMYTILNRHFEKISFRERNAGPDLDSVMSDEGFEVECGVDFDTGFIYGGNQFNCGTWMDKMGSSKKAGNFGVPATPRDGSAVELVGICYAIVNWLDHLKTTKKFNYDGVKNPTRNIQWTWKQWADLIKLNFESYFWVPENLNDAKFKFPNETEIINVLGIYKDSYRSSRKYTDYQLKPNFLIALVVAPELFAENKVSVALSNVVLNLMAPIGIKTLSTGDWEYRGFYNNSDDTDDYSTSKGFSYHQGPEWVWPVAFLVRSIVHFLKKHGPKSNEYIKFAPHIRNYLDKWFENEQKNKWGGLPEITNKDGKFCEYSCNTQSWSISAALDVVHAIHSSNFQLY